MRRIVPADPVLRDVILDQTHRQWHDGLSRERYGQYNEAQMRTAWGAAHLSRVALVENGRVLSSAKQYDLQVQIDGVRHPTIGLGAVFTPPDLRGRGYAAEIIEGLLSRAREAGATLAMLFSEIGTSYYARLGFTVVPITEVDVTVRRPPGSPALLVRAGEDRDLPFIVESQAMLASRYRCALAWSTGWLQYSIAKKRLLAAFGPPGHREVEFFVTEEGGRPAAWVLLHVSGRNRPGYLEAWSLEACGDRDPTGARVGALLQALLARTPAAAPPLIRAWWPAGLEPPQVTIVPRPTTGITLMVRALAPAAAAAGALAAPDVVYWHGDAF